MRTSTKLPDDGLSSLVAEELYAFGFALDMPLLCNGKTQKPVQVIKFDEIHIIVKSFFLDAGQSKT